MKNMIGLIFQLAAVFVGTIVGAGLASGKEITNFFAAYGFPSFFGILLCGVLYILIGSLVCKISVKYNLQSYNEFMTFVSPNFLGKLTGLITSLFLLSSASIILAASGALLNQFLGVPKWVGMILMGIFTLSTLLKDTQGLVKINTFIVPCLITIIITIFSLYIFFYKDIITISHLAAISCEKDNWFTSTLLYTGFNLLSCTGVLVPLSREIKNIKVLTTGVVIGASILTILCIFLNIMLMLNKPYIYDYEIPLLYIANRFGKPLQIMLLMVIWCEMFSTQVSDIYSISKTLDERFKIPFKKGIFLVFLVTIPISQIGFGRLISILYPFFGALSLIFLSQLILFYIRLNKKSKS